MKFYVHYKNPDPDRPYYGVYDIYVKRWWFSRKKPVVLNKEVEGGLATVVNCILIPYIKSFHSCVASSDAVPKEREVKL